MNTYGYVFNNPLILQDLLGLAGGCSVGTTIVLNGQTFTCELALPPFQPDEVCNAFGQTMECASGQRLPPGVPITGPISPLGSAETALNLTANACALIGASSPIPEIIGNLDRVPDAMNFLEEILTR